jgi:hypothetical protein
LGTAIDGCDSRHVFEYEHPRLEFLYEAKELPKQCPPRLITKAATLEPLVATKKPLRCGDGERLTGRAADKYVHPTPPEFAS